jgi:multiple sugar transport system substrate-binding protein
VPKLARCAVLLLMPLVAALPACHGASADRQTVRVVFWAGVEEQRVEQANVDAFTRAHPGTRISLESIPDNYLEKLAAAFAAHKPPDVLLLDSVLIPRFLEGGVLLDLQPYLEADPAFSEQQFIPQVWDIAVRRPPGGRQSVYALPKDFTPLVVYYNRRLFDTLRVPYPKDGWTWDDFAATARALTRDDNGDGRTDTYGTLVYTWMGYNIVWFWQAGGDVLSPDGKRATGFLDSPASVRAVDFITGLVNSGAAPDPTAREALGGQAFMSGKVGMTISGHWAIPGFRAAAEESATSLRLTDIGVVGLPRDAERASVIYESGWAVAQDTRHPELAVEVSKYLASEEAQRRRAEIGLALSANRAVAADYARQDPREQVFLDEVAHCRAPWGTRIADWSVVEQLIGEAIERVLLHRATSKQALHDAARLIDAELNML